MTYRYTFINGGPYDGDTTDDIECQPTTRYATGHVYSVLRGVMVDASAIIMVMGYDGRMTAAEYEAHAERVCERFAAAKALLETLG